MLQNILDLKDLAEIKCGIPWTLVEEPKLLQMLLILFFFAIFHVCMNVCMNTWRNSVLNFQDTNIIAFSDMTAHSLCN